jgi:hypothetical protein
MPDRSRTLGLSHGVPLSHSANSDGASLCLSTAPDSFQCVCCCLVVCSKMQLLKAGVCVSLTLFISHSINIVEWMNDRCSQEDSLRLGGRNKFAGHSWYSTGNRLQWCSGCWQRHSCLLGSEEMDTMVRWALCLATLTWWPLLSPTWPSCFEFHLGQLRLQYLAAALNHKVISKQSDACQSCLACSTLPHSSSNHRMQSRRTARHQPLPTAGKSPRMNAKNQGWWPELASWGTWPASHIHYLTQSVALDRLLCQTLSYRQKGGLQTFTQRLKEWWIHPFVQQIFIEPLMARLRIDQKACSR